MSFSSAKTSNRAVLREGGNGKDGVAETEWRKSKRAKDFWRRVSSPSVGCSHCLPDYVASLDNAWEIVT